MVVTINGKNVNVVSATFNAIAELNGPWVKLVDSTREGELKVGFANDQLKISIFGFLPEYLAPRKMEFDETITFTQSSVAGKINAHHVFSSALAEFNADSECVYVKN
jgi:SpoU rRNA methylase family enzyme